MATDTTSILTAISVWNKKIPAKLTGLTLTLSRDNISCALFIFFLGGFGRYFFLEPYRNAGAFNLFKLGFGNIAFELVDHSVDSGEPV